jgi:general secretion pathway protein B
VSYILEALKRAEHQTEDMGVPRLLSHAGATERERGPLWPYPLIAALLLNAGLIIWWLSPWWPEERQSIVQVPIVHPNMPAASAKPFSEPGVENRSSDTKGAPKETIVSKPITGTLRKEGREAPLSTSGKSPSASGSSPQPRTRTENKATVDDRVLSLEELPSAVRSSLPVFKVSGHAYSPDPGSRVTRINDQILQEGQNLAPGLKVEEITPGGVVLGHKGYRFRIDINMN